MHIQLSRQVCLSPSRMELLADLFGDQLSDLTQKLLLFLYESKTADIIDIPRPTGNFFTLFDPMFSKIGANVPGFLIDTGRIPI